MPTSDGDLLLRGILDNPDDDTVRKVYADWLEENGEVRRAEHIRLQIARVYGEMFTPACLLNAEEEMRWFPLVGNGTVPFWYRGFVHRVHLPCDAFMQHAESLFRAHPITSVRLSGVVRERTVFRTSSGHSGDIPHELWENLQIPRCVAVGPCQMAGTHAHLIEDELSFYLVTYGRKLAGLSPLPTPELVK